MLASNSLASVPVSSSTTCGASSNFAFTSSARTRQIALPSAARRHSIDSRNTSLPPWVRDYTWLSIGAAVTFGVFLVSIDILAPRKKLVVFSGTSFGLPT